MPGNACEVNYQTFNGGCAIVRQEATIIGSDVSYNGGDGIYVKSIADNYGSIYDSFGRPHYPSLVIAYSTVNGNGGDGLHLYNDISANSYLFQYVYLVDSSFDHNGGAGVVSTSYVSGGSTMLQLATLYSYAAPMTTDYNRAAGVDVETTTTGAGSYAFTRILSLGQDASYNGAGSAGIGLVTQSYDPVSTSVGALDVSSGTFNGNYAGIVGVAYGTGAYQYAYVGLNSFINNTYGITGIALDGAFQYFDVSSGNAHSGDGSNYHFYADPASFQFVAY